MTDNHLGINIESKFADIRAKSKDEYISIKKKKGDKRNNIKMPVYKMGQNVVITDGYYKGQERINLLVEIIDFYLGDFDREIYYGIILKTNHKKYLERIGRIIGFKNPAHFFEFGPANISPDSVRWLDDNTN